jgi:hypothetical protein
VFTECEYFCSFQVKARQSHIVTVDISSSIHRVYNKKNATSEFPKKSTLQFLSIKDFRPLGIEIELLIELGLFYTSNFGRVECN